MLGTLLPLAVRSPSQLEVDVEANRVQARWEFDRARDVGTDGDMAAWAKRWGPSFTRDVSRIEDEVASLEDQISELQSEVEAPTDTSAVDPELDDVRACVETALEQLDGIDAAADAVAQLKDALTYVAKAHKELDQL